MNNVTLTPINTAYNGYRFRSRLEARWAVFFEQCDLQYLYEDQGFSLPGGSYLPDFYFPEIGGFLEVKPRSMLPVRHFEFECLGSFPIRDDIPRELVLANELALASNGLVLVVYGDPVDVFVSREGGAVCAGKNGPRAGYPIEYILFLSHRAMSAALEEAAQAARSARFERGENSVAGRR